MKSRSQLHICFGKNELMSTQNRSCSKPVFDHFRQLVVHVCTTPLGCDRKLRHLTKFRPASTKRSINVSFNPGDWNSAPNRLHDIPILFQQISLLLGAKVFVHKKAPGARMAPKPLPPQLLGTISRWQLERRRHRSDRPISISVGATFLRNHFLDICLGPQFFRVSFFLFLTHFSDDFDLLWLNEERHF